MCFLKYLSIVIVYIMIDAPYLMFNKNYYKSKIKAIAGNDKTFTNRYYSALLVYIALALGMMVLVLPRIKQGSTTDIIADSILYGGMLGFASYVTIDFTMHFMFEGWDLGVSIMDTIWGVILSSLVAMIITFLWRM